MTRYARYVLVLMVACLPAIGLADDVPPSDQAAPTASSEEAPAAGPTANPLQPTSSGSSTMTSSILQPAAGAGESNNSGLQSAGTGGAAQAPSANALQQTGSNEQVKLLIQGEAEGQQTLSEPPNLTWLLYILYVLVAVTGITAAVWLWSRRYMQSSK